jgi:hypothetical protein
MDSDSLMGGMPDLERSRRARRRKSHDGETRDDDSLLERTRTTLTDAGLTVALASVEEGKGSGSGFQLSEGLEAFIRCAELLDRRVAFVDPLYLSADHFLTENEDEDIDLRDIEPKLRQFERYIGSCHLVSVTGCFGNNVITCLETSDWFDTWAELRTSAMEAAEEGFEQAEERREREQEERQKEVRARIQALAKDPGFKTFMRGARQTFETIIAYMREHVEGANEMSPGMLREEARALRGKLLLG